MRRTSLTLVALAAVVAAAPGARAQSSTGVIQGTVRGESGVPLSDVTVSVVGTTLGAMTRADGRYTISGVAAGAHQVRATRIGYAMREQPVTVAAGQPASLDFSLPSVAVSLDQVVVIGYGTQTKRDLTGAVGSVQASQIATMPVPRVDQAITGLVSGVQVQATNAQPGAVMRIRIRGGNSLNGSNEPLVVADGVIGADLNQINPGDIESVEVLKDASATAIYGARAANGVILLTTKRGAPGRVRFEYSGYIGQQTVTKTIDLLSADEFARLYMRNPNRDKSISFDTTRAMPTTDWQEEVYRGAPMRSNEIRVSGSNGGTSMMFSANVLQQDGIVLGSDFGRGTVRFNLDQDIGSRFKLGTRVSYSHSLGNEVRVNDGYGSAGGSITATALRFAPTIPLYDSTGNFSGPLISSQTIDNPLAIARLRDDKTTTNYLLGNLFGDYTLLPGLTVRTSVAYTNRGVLGQRYTSRQLRQFLNQGQAVVDNNLANTWLSENTATLRRTLFGSHDLTLLGGFTAQQTRRSANSETGQGFTSDLLGYRRINLAETVTGSSSAGRDRLMSYLGRVNYSIAGKYLLTGTLRTDGSSKFAANNKWATFPSAALAWRVSDEGWFGDGASGVSDLKLRASWGKTGSEAIGSYQSLGAFSVGSIYTIGTTRFNNGAKPSRNANPNLRWETTTQRDVGLDLGMFDDRVSLTVDAYDKRTDDLLYEKQVPYHTGFESYVTNVGKVRNRGLEFTLDTRHAVGPVELRLGGNVSFNRSKVLDLGGDREFFIDGVNSSLPRYRPAAVVRVGEPLGNYFGYLWDGIFQSQAEVTASGQAGAAVGTMKLRDVNGDGRIDSNDRTILGNAQPDYLFSQNGSVSWRGVTVSYLLRGVQGFEIANLNREGMSTPGASTNQLRGVLDYWTPLNPTNGMTAIGVSPYDAMTSRWVEDGSFVRLQNVTVGWDVPQRLGRRVGASSLRLYVSGQNLFTKTKYSWYDPEVSSRGTSDLDLGWDDASYPATRTLTLGANISF
jgi:TonB-dependent starch-binding outer membrane protein SusC